MSSRSGILRKAERYITSGSFPRDLEKAVSYRTVSGTSAGRISLDAYLTQVLTPSLEDLGCDVQRFDCWNGSDNSFLIGTRTENPELPTVLCYGHADVVAGQDGDWAAGRSPWKLTLEGGRWYGRGTADNKGQHLVNLTALHLVLAEQESLGFNLKFLFECGEEIGSPALAEFASAHRDELSADVFIASDGPRLDAETPTIFLGSRGSAGFDLVADLRPDSYHSGNWGGLLRNPATTLAAAIGTLVDGHGRIQIDGLLPPEFPASVRGRLADIAVVPGAGDPKPDDGWGEPNLSPAERLYGWNTLEVLAIAAADVDNPINAIPGSARAVLQLRFVAGTDISNYEGRIQRHLEARGLGMVRARATTVFPASRLDPDNPWVEWASSSIRETTGQVAAVLPNFGGSLPNHVFEDILGLPTLWIPHSYPGCLQHAPNEHMIESIAHQGLQIACGLFYDLGRSHGGTTPSQAAAATA
ncbi:acetylornithine deacetylase/succinyl-diaminopimelate desuccinylase-like protein [Arthrobacter globiformis]|uniref:M20 family metallopeptidase n=1 Tax=Arthrobacter globiformis TaxID=1665 RepID=UPI00278B7E55|nr:M20 family metallopeptidase [Arthrobacter globiformis]MDQ1060262.1 acetylornithine deacetylase/succinyl-diaminopimelate desuccinylase-like protein [Arthrobacter globiformis]